MIDRKKKDQRRTSLGSSPGYTPHAPGFDATSYTIGYEAGSSSSSSDDSSSSYDVGSDASGSW